MNKEKFDIFSLPWKGFLISLVITFLVTSLHLLSALPTFNFLNGFGKTQNAEVGAFSKLLPKLEEKGNNYKLKKQGSVFASAYASSLLATAPAYLVVDFDTGEVLAEKNMNERHSVASLTKIMTSVVALDLSNASEEFSVSNKAASQIPTKIGVVPGERMKVWELLNASLLTSANDAVEVLKEGVDNKYKEEVFIKAMNKKAKIIGLKNTSFDNPQGFDGMKNYSTASDLAILSHYAYNNYPLFKEIVKKDYVFLPEDKNHKQFDLQNWNGLIGVYPNVLGLKIGNTEEAGRTTIVISEREGKKILAVVLGAPGILERDLWGAQLLDYGFEKTLNLSPIEVTPENLQEKYDKWQYFE